MSTPQTSSALSHIHRGFFACFNTPGKEKVPQTKNISDEACKTLEELANTPNIDGYLRDGVVLVDFDDRRDALAFDKILRHLNLRVPSLATTKGKHFYFLANEYCPTAINRAMLACGLKADFKLGSKRGLDCIKFHGVMREWENIDAALIPLPHWCSPLHEAPSKSGDSLTSLQEGTRNDTLFKFNGRLSRSGFSKDDAQWIIRNIINPCVLNEPLSDEEILSVSRDDVYTTQHSHYRSVPVYSNGGDRPDLSTFFEGKNLRQDLLAAYLIELWHVIDIGATTYYYNDGVYTPLNEWNFGKMIVAIYPQLNDNRRKEVFKQLVFMCPSFPLDEPDKYLKFIAFSNGILNIETGEFVTPSPDYIILNKIPFAYKPDATSVVLDEFIQRFTCNDESVATLLYEIVGHCLYRKNSIRGCFIFVGKKRNGKSTFLDMLQFALGDDNVSLLKMQELSDRFKTAELQNKLANIGDDIPDDFIPDTNKLKSAATSNPLVVERKWGNPFSIVPYATLIFSANDLPRLKDNTGAMLDRVTLVPCSAYFSVTTPGYDPDMPAKLKTQEVAEALLARGIEGLKRLLTQKALTKGFSSMELMNQYQEFNNPVLAFLRDELNGFGGNLEQLQRQDIDSIFMSYCVFCASEGIRHGTKAVFSKKVVSVVGNCKTVRQRTHYGRARFFSKINVSSPFYIQL